MSNPTQEYNDYIRANLPYWITYDEDRARYVTWNGKYFPTYLEAKWYSDYIIKFGADPSPLSLFANGEQGAWYDPSDLTTLYQDAAGTTPVTADGDPVGYMADKSGNGNHATQSTAAARPVYRTDGTLHWLEADGVDDILLSPANLDFSDPNYCMAAAAKDTGGTGQFFGTDFDTPLGGRRFALASRDTNTIRAFDRNDGDVTLDVVADTLITQVYLLNHTSSGKLLRVNEVSYEQVTSTATVSQNSRVSVFSSATSAAYFFGGVVINRELTSADISKTESYLAAKSGVTL